MLNRVLTVRIQDGLRAKAAAAFVDTASTYVSQMTIQVGNKKVNAKSIIGVLSLGARCGDDIHLFVVGPDEQEAMQAMIEITEGARL